MVLKASGVHHREQHGAYHLYRRLMPRLREGLNGHSSTKYWEEEGHHLDKISSNVVGRHIYSLVYLVLVNENTTMEMKKRKTMTIMTKKRMKGRSKTVLLDPEQDWALASVRTCWMSRGLIGI